MRGLRIFGPKRRVGRQVPMAFLERIKDDFVLRFGSEKATTTAVNSLNKEFGFLIRGEKIEVLVDKTANLRSEAQDFQSKGNQMRRKMWLQNMKVELIVLGILITLILIIILSVCHGFNC